MRERQRWNSSKAAAKEENVPMGRANSGASNFLPRLVEPRTNISSRRPSFGDAAAADSVTAHALQVPAGSPIFLIERTSYTTGNRPVDYERLHYRGDLIRFVTRLARRPRASVQTGGA